MVSSLASVLALLLGFLSTLAQAQESPKTSARASVAGIWLGTLHTGTRTLRIQLHMPANELLVPPCFVDSIDQKVFWIPCGDVKVNGNSVSFDVPSANAKWIGVLSSDGRTLTGTWTQGGPLPLVMERQNAAIDSPKPTPLDPAIPPVPLANLKSVLDRDLAARPKAGELAPSANAGVTIGVVQQGKRLIFAYGTARADSVFEIGSISKTFTALILAQMVVRGTVRLDEPLRELLQTGTVAKPASGAEITLLDLSDQHLRVAKNAGQLSSGAPRESLRRRCGATV